MVTCYSDRDQACPVHPLSADLKAGRVAAEGARVDSEVQSRIADRKYVSVAH